MNEEYKGIEKMTPEEKTISFMNNYFVFMKSTSSRKCISLLC